MAAPKKKRSLSKRYTRKSNKFFKNLSLTLNKENNKLHIRHHILNNYYENIFKN